MDIEVDTQPRIDTLVTDAASGGRPAPSTSGQSGSTAGRSQPA